MKQYFDILKRNIEKKLSEDIEHDTVVTIVEKYLKYHFANESSKKFQEYYFSTVSNESFFLSTETFFRTFKFQYALQGIDNEYLALLEKNKEDILFRIKQDQITELYFDYFAKAQIKYGSSKRPRELSSFFSKLVHTFRPDEYCALDNPIKNYFGLQKESFFVSFHLISTAFREWAKDNNELILKLRDGLKSIDTDNSMPDEHITDLKLLDLIYWTKSNALG